MPTSKVGEARLGLDPHPGHGHPIITSLPARFKMNIAGTPRSALLTRFSPNRLRVYIPVAPHCCTSLSYSTRSAIVILIRARPAMASNPGPSSAAAAAPDNSSRPGLEASSAPPKKKKTHRGGKKRRNRRQSFAAGADLAQGDSMDERE